MTVATAEKARIIDFVAARRAMIDSQLRTSGISDGVVISRMRAVPREDYVPDHARSLAYIDRSIPIGDGRTLPSPLFHGLLLQDAKPTLADDVLIVDSGSGYLPALVEPLVASMKVISAADALKGSRSKDRYTLLLVDGAVQHLPPALVKRLADKARIVTGLSDNGVTRIVSGQKAGDGVALMPLLDIGIPIFPQLDAKREWRF